MVTDSEKVTRRQAAVDLIIVGACCSLYIFFAFFRLPIIPVILVVVAALAGFACLLWYRRRERWRDFGFRLDNLVRSALWVIPPTLVVAAAFSIYALAQGRTLWRWELLVLLPLYPIWGVLQQLIFQGVVFRRLRLLAGQPLTAIVLTSVGFALVHLPDVPLVGLTLVAGAAWAYAFQQIPNLWVLGFSHGFLAALTYPLLLNQNPVRDFF